MAYVSALPEMVEMCKELVEAHHGHLDGMKIGIIGRETAAKRDGKTVLGKASLPPKRLRPLLNDEYDYIIELAVDMWERLEDQYRRALLDHELCHCGKGEKGEPKMKAHDLEEFAGIIRRHGQWRCGVAEEAVKQSFLFREGIKVEGVNIQRVG